MRTIDMSSSPKQLKKIQFVLLWMYGRPDELISCLGRRWRTRIRAAMKLILLAFLACAPLLAADTHAGGCSSAMESSYPKASITNGAVQAVLYLSDAKNGYYRASRFDWSGIIPCLSYKGHTYFGIWFSHYDPMVADAIAGPVEEFRSVDGALNCPEAYIHLVIAPGQTAHWNIRYRFFAT
jgi:hypothetical protein